MLYCSVNTVISLPLCRVFEGLHGRLCHRHCKYNTPRETSDPLTSTNSEQLNTSRIGENVIEELNKLLPSCDTIPKQQRDVFSGFAADITSNAGIAATAVSNLAAKTIASHSSTKPANIASAAEGKVTAFFSEIHSKATHVESEIKSAATSLAHKAEAGFCKDLNTLDSDVAGAVTDIAKHLGLHDFYSVHIMDWCEGCASSSPL